MLRNTPAPAPTPVPVADAFAATRQTAARGATAVLAGLTDPLGAGA